MTNLGKVFILGDSYSTFKGCNPEGFAVWYSEEEQDRTDVRSVGETWWHILLSNTSSVLVQNCSYSGSTVCHTGYGGSDCSHNSFAARIDKLIDEGFFEKNKIDTFFIFGATNDCWAESPRGRAKLGDWTVEDLYSLYPAFAYMLSRIKGACPQARVIFIMNHGLCRELEKELKALCLHYGAEFLQLERFDTNERHPTVAGMKGISEQVLSYLERTDREREKKRYKSISFAGALAALVALLIFFIPALIENKRLQITEIPVSSKKLPESFDGFRIAQISDLHNDEFGENNEKLLACLESTHPDIIVVTGDLVDSRRTALEPALGFMKGALNIAPCYYVTGNHELRLEGEKDELLKGLEALGVNVLCDRAVKVEKGSDSIWVCGVDDAVYDSPLLGDTLERVLRDTDGYRVLLSHKPDHVEKYRQSGAELVFCGHAHGGQFILPGLGGIFAPGQGTFPKYYSGIYTEGDTSMIVSRGLGNSAFPLRINNRPEIVVAELSSK